jgi:hypothetical protein
LEKAALVFMRIRGTFVHAVRPLGSAGVAKAALSLLAATGDFAHPLCRAISLPHRPPVDYDVHTWVHQKTKAKS